MEKMDKRKIWLTAGGAAVLVVLLLTVMIAFGGGDRLKGTWALDDVTSYEFRGNGKGAMVLQSSEYPFTYRTEGDTLSIDFAAEEAADREYTYSIDGDTLTLESGAQRYQMTRQK